MYEGRGSFPDNLAKKKKKAQILLFVYGEPLQFVNKGTNFDLGA